MSVWPAYGNLRSIIAPVHCHDLDQGASDGEQNVSFPRSKFSIFLLVVGFVGLLPHLLIPSVKEGGGKTITHTHTHTSLLQAGAWEEEKKKPHTIPCPPGILLFLRDTHTLTHILYVPIGMSFSPLAPQSPKPTISFKKLLEMTS